LQDILLGRVTQAKTPKEVASHLDAVLEGA